MADWKWKSRLKVVGGTLPLIKNRWALKISNAVKVLTYILIFYDTPCSRFATAPLFLLCMLISGLLSRSSANICHQGSTESFALVTHQVVVDWFLSGLVVGLLHFRLLQRMCYVQCTDVEAAVFVVTVAVIKR